MIQSFKEVMNDHEVRSHVRKLGPTLPHDINGFWRSYPFTHRGANEGWRMLHFLQDF
jgi:hypothetical protein